MSYNAGSPVGTPPLGSPKTQRTLDSKICFIGSSGVGKTSLVYRYVSGTFNPAVDSTIGASFMTKRIVLDGVKVKMQIWDTAGQERFRSMAPMYYRNVSAAVVMFDITSEGSFAEMQGWVQELRTNVGADVGLFIVGNKKDLADKRRVSVSSATKYADAIGAQYSETSAKTNDGVEELFLRICQDLVAKAFDLPKAEGSSTRVQLASEADKAPATGCMC